MAEPSEENSPKAFLETLFKNYATFYESLLGRYLRMPRFGLGGEPVQEAAAAADAFYQWAEDAGKFMVDFSRPLQEALEVLTQNLDPKAEDIESAKDLYNRIVAVLDERYDAFLRSPEGTRRVIALVHRFLEFKKRYDHSLEPWFRWHGIPTRRDMEDVYRSLHDLKRKNRALEAENRKMNALIETLSRRVLALEKPRVQRSGTRQSQKLLKERRQKGSGVAGEAEKKAKRG